MTNDLEKCEATIRSLEDQRDNLLGRAKILSKQRQEVSHAAYTGNAKARQQLDKLNTETSTLGYELENIQSAIDAETKKLDVARKAEAQAADKAAALQLREAIAEFVEEGNELDASLEDMAFHANALSDALNKIHQLGAKAPTFEQVRVNGAHCFKSALMKTSWKKEFEFEHIPSHKLQSFKFLVSGWASMLMKDVERRLGVGEKKKEAA